jgi:gas vesicle protein
MKLLYKITFLAIFTLSTAIIAQKTSNKKIEEFNTNSDVIINLNTRYSDIEIETWNKNKVVIEATVEIFGASKEKEAQIRQNWDFKAIGNKNEINVTSKTMGFPIDKIMHANRDFEHLQDFDFEFPEISVGNLAILDSLRVVMPNEIHFPELMVLPDLENLKFSFDSMSFDYDKYKKDQNYLKEWQEEMKRNLEKMQIEIKENSAKHKEELKAAQEERKKHMLERKKHMAELQKERADKLKEATKYRKEVLEKRQEEMRERRYKVRDILAENDKIKIKRIIKIKAPKDAKFNMNVSYGSVSFPN